MSPGPTRANCSPPTMPSAERQEHAADDRPKPSPIPAAAGDVKPAAVLSTFAAAAVDPATAPRRKRKKTTTPLPLPEHEVEEEEEEERGKQADAETPCEESRRLFQKLWTDVDEITILEGFLEFTSQRGTTHADYQHDTGPFYEQIKGSLQLDFNRNQLVEKLRRLKKKYRNMAARMAENGGRGAFAFRSPHDKATFDIASKIWNPTFKRPNRSHDTAESVNGPNPSKSFELGDAAVAVLDSAASQEGAGAAAPEVSSAELKHPPPETTAVATYRTTANASSQSQGSLPSSAEPPLTVPAETSAEQMMKSDSFWSPFKEPHQCASGGELCGLSSRAAMAFGERWKQQRILELEVYLKRVELVHEQVKSKLEELRSQHGISN